MRQLRAHRILSISGILLFAVIFILETIKENLPQRHYWINLNLHIDINFEFSVWEMMLFWLLLLLPIVFFTASLIWNYQRSRKKSGKMLYRIVLITGFLCTAALIFICSSLWSNFAEDYMQPRNWLDQATEFIVPTDYTKKGFELAVCIISSVLLAVSTILVVLTLIIRNKPAMGNKMEEPVVS